MNFLKKVSKVSSDLVTVIVLLGNLKPLLQILISMLEAEQKRRENEQKV